MPLMPLMLFAKSNLVVALEEGMWEIRGGGAFHSNLRTLHLSSKQKMLFQVGIPVRLPSREISDRKVSSVQNKNVFEKNGLIVALNGTDPCWWHESRYTVYRFAWF
jgi:hypothetical protein